MRLVEYLHCCL